MSRHSSQMCEKYQVALDLLAKRWMGQIVHALSPGPLRFGELSAQLEVIGDKMLTERLKELEEHGILERRVLQRPLGVEYGLTKKGQALKPVFGAVEQWADKWLALPAARKAR
jgi:DNA-binding HxlR family transcriptional regulator